jgi:hypothetical protein
MAIPSPESDCSKATQGAPVTGCDLHAQVMGGPPKTTDQPVDKSAAGAATEVATSPAVSKVVVQIELTQPIAPKEPEHIKVHHNVFSKVSHSIGHFGKQYALGLKDSVEPRNLGRMTLPVGISLGSELVVANQIKQGIKGGFNQVGAGITKLGQGETQLAAGQVQMAQELAALQSEITALQGLKGASTMAGAVGKTSGTFRESSAMIAPKISSGVTPEAVISAPLQSASPVAAPEANIALSAGGSATGLVGGARLQTAAFDNTPGASSGGPTITDANSSNLNAPNVGLDGKGFAVPMTPKQLEKARDYQASANLSETQLANAGNAFKSTLDQVADSMSTSQDATAFINDLKMRYQYAMTYDHMGDHITSRAYLSDCKQDTDNLKRLAKSEHNPGAVDQLDSLKQTVNDLDNVEKHFQKRPSIVLARTAEQITGSI